MNNTINPLDKFNLEDPKMISKIPLELQLKCNECKSTDIAYILKFVVKEN